MPWCPLCRLWKPWQPQRMDHIPHPHRLQVTTARSSSLLPPLPGWASRWHCFFLSRDQSHYGVKGQWMGQRQFR